MKPGTYSWGVQTIDATYTGSTFTEGPQFTITEEDIASNIKNVKNHKDLKVIYNLAGQQLQKPQKGINIINSQKVLQNK